LKIYIFFLLLLLLEEEITCPIALWFISDFNSSIPLTIIYKIFTDLYFNTEADKVQIDKDKLASKIKSILKKNYPDHYELLRKLFIYFSSLMAIHFNHFAIFAI